MGTPQDEKFTQALRGIPEENYQYASRLFQCLVAAIRPLSLKELAGISAELDPNAGPHEDAVLSACPALIARDKGDPTIVQFSHKSVKEFLTSNRLRTSSIENSSCYHFSPEAANATLARVCISVLLRFDETMDKTQLMESSPLALYAAQYWVQHTQQGNALTENQEVTERLFDPSKSHLEAWIWMYDIDKGQSRTMENIAERPSQRTSGTPLYYAALCGFTELVKHLASLRPEHLHDSDGHYSTPLHAASYKGHYDTVLALLDNNSNMNKEVNNKTPLHAAYYGGQPKIIELLLEKGADVDAKGILDNTLLHRASLDGRQNVVEILLRYDAVVNAKDKNGWTPLHGAALNGRVEVAKHLLNFKKDGHDEKLDVNIRSNNMNTPLHIASIAGNLEMVEFLLSHGAKTGIKGDNGWTPLEAAEKNRHKEIVELLSRGWGWRANNDRWWGFDRLRDLLRSSPGDLRGYPPGFV